MSGVVKVAFGSLSAPKGSALVVFVGADMKPAPMVTAQFGDLEPLIRAAAKASNFRGAQRTALDILAPAGLDASRLVVVGVAPGKDNAPVDFVTLGGFTFGKVTGAKRVEVAFEAPAGTWDGPAAADFALGLRLRGYRFDKYKTRKKDADDDSAEAPDFRHRLEPCGRRARRRPGPLRRRRRRRIGAQSGQRAAERALSGRVRRSGQVVGEARRRGGDARREGDGQARDERSPGGGPGIGAREPSRHDAMERGAIETDQTDRDRRQGGVFRFRRHLHQALRRHGGHERRHGRRGLRRRTPARARRAQGESQRGRRHRTGREHARRRRDPARRHHHLDVRTDDRDRQYRRRGAARAGRRALVRAGDIFAAGDHRPCHADRRHHGRARA